MQIEFKIVSIPISGVTRMKVSNLTNLRSNVHSPSIHLITTSVRDHELNDPGPRDIVPCQGFILRLRFPVRVDGDVTS